jgi:hypothetical protein
MGFVKKAINKKKREIKRAARKKVTTAVRSAVPGLCPKTGSGRHEYKNQNKGGMPVIACKCGVMP